ncbi:MAG: N-acetylmuramoyl-L-alanine amidase [Bacteroidales bacterium]|jgi:N-acetylmuramoyl-L-alanine amidase|nr:N-acetylmuramoyl-L-alanine amidase [Bacteroidales bacterium]
MTITLLLRNNAQKAKKRALLCIFSALFCIAPTIIFGQSAYTLRTVVIDAGHGGKDPGAVGKKAKEKDLTLAMALKTGKLIKDNFPSVNVIYTRQTDEFVELYRRAEIANRANADLFISIHVNASTNIVASGTDSWIMGLSKSNANLEVAKRENKVIGVEADNVDQYKGFSADDTESIIIYTMMQSANLEHSGNLAALCQTEFRDKVGRKDRGVHTAPFLVLWQTTMPSVLIETGFISNAEEEAYLMTNEGQTALSEAIYRAFANYKSNIETKSNVKVAQQATSTMRPRETPKPEEKKEEPQKVTVSEQPEVMLPPTTPTRQPGGQAQANEVFVPREVTPQAKPTTPAPQKQTPPANVARTASNNSIYYSIQIIASKTEIAPTSNRFKGIRNVYAISEDGLYKYNVGKTATYAEITQIQQQVKTQFPDSFVVARKGNTRIPLGDARKITN